MHHIQVFLHALLRSSYTVCWLHISCVVVVNMVWIIVVVVNMVWIWVDWINCWLRWLRKDWVYSSLWVNVHVCPGRNICILITILLTIRVKVTHRTWKVIIMGMLLANNIVSCSDEFVFQHDASHHVN